MSQVQIMTYKENIDHRQVMFVRWPKIPNHPIEVQPDELPLLLEKKKEGYLFTRKMLWSIEMDPLMKKLQEDNSKLK